MRFKEKTKRRRAKLFRLRYREIFLLCDLLLILGLLMSFGALTITNALVMQKAKVENIKIEIVEVNPVAEKVHNLEGAKTPEQKIKFNKILQALWIHSMILALITTWILWVRFHIKNKKELIGYLFVMVYLFIFFGNDFFNDFGFLIGKLLFG